MSFNIVLLLVSSSFRVTSAQIRIPITWSESAPFAPQVQLTVDIPNVISVTNFTCIDMFGLGQFFVHHPYMSQSSEITSDHSVTVANLALLGSDMRWFGWEQMTERISSRTNPDPFGFFDVSINSPFLRMANSFMIIPTEFIINPRVPVDECDDSTSSMVFVQGVFSFSGVDLWGFEVANHTVVQIKAHDEMILLTPQEDSRFVSEILDALNENMIFVDRTPHRPWHPRYLVNCDIDLLDEILPILEFSISENFKIHINPREYIYPYNGPGADSNSCFIAVSASTRGVKIGSGLFRKHAVFFDPLNRLLGICLARG